MGITVTFRSFPGQAVSGLLVVIHCMLFHYTCPRLASHLGLELMHIAVK